MNVGDEAEGRRRWEEAGRPLVPSLVFRGVTTPVMHVSQLAETLGLDPPRSGFPLRDARDASTILDAWLDRLRPLPWDALLAPTPSRGRSVRNLTVNVFHPFELLPGAWTTGRFEWRPEDDDEREARLPDRGDLLRFAGGALEGWRRFLDVVGEELEDRDSRVTSPRGEVPFSTLLSFQRWHAAFHYRQLQVVTGGEDTILPGLEDLVLPAEVF